MVISDTLWKDILRYIQWRADRVDCDQAKGFILRIQLEDNATPSVEAAEAAGEKRCRGR